MSDTILKILETISSYVWGLPMIILLIGTGIFLTVRLGMIQVFSLPKALKMVFSRSQAKGEGDISPFKALMTALSATIGTGNIAGVATAIAAGGPGALFWMWITAIFGMATKYSEALLAVKYRVKDANGEMIGGPMYALERGLGMKWLGVLFAIFGSIAAFGLGNMVQSNAVSEALKETFNVTPWITGFILAILVAAVILGGIKRIGEVAGFLVPIMASIYMLCALMILIMNIKAIPGALSQVFLHAFSPTAATGGFLGAMIKETIQSGVSRGLFSNESGLGSAPIAAAAAKTPSPKYQALISMTGTFIDTLVVCTMTGLVIIITGSWFQELSPDVDKAAQITIAAFDKGFFGNYGGYVVSIGLIFFAYSTILGWSYYGEKCFEYLFGVKAVLPYRLVWVGFVFLGSVTQLAIVWTFADIMNALMAAPNLIALLFLSSVIVKETKETDV
ncbi:amino acid carrier protein [bacterium]|nr:amino acid carrier protein [bacterium]